MLGNKQRGQPGNVHVDVAQAGLPFVVGIADYAAAPSGRCTSARATPGTYDSDTRLRVGLTRAAEGTNSTHK